MGQSLSGIALVRQIRDRRDHIRDRRDAYLHIEVAAEVTAAGFVLIRTTVENKGAVEKKIEYAALLVGREIEGTGAFNELAPVADVEPITDTEQIVQEDYRVPFAVADGQGRALIPLTFYYEENSDIADEKVGYVAPLEARAFPSGVPIAVRFYIFGEKQLHRSTVTTFVIPPRSAPTGVTARPLAAPSNRIPEPDPRPPEGGQDK